MKYKKYKNEFDYSYCLGPFPSFELIESRPEKVQEVYISENFNDKDKLIEICHKKSIGYIVGEKQINVVSEKDRSYVVAFFDKYNSKLDNNSPHIVLHNPSDMGNLGTIIRSMLAFGFKNLAIIKPCADVWNPKVIRASMGAIFKINLCVFENFEEYYNQFSENRDFFPFMLTAKTQLSLEDCPKSEKYSLIFGNEARGLPSEFSEIGTAIIIPQSDEVDSLNLGVSVAVASFIFKTKN